MKIFVIRHGETDLNRAKILQSQTEDGKLNAQGVAQAHASIGALPSGLTICFSSPLTRARQTAEIVAPHFKLPIIFCDELKEKHYGSLSGKPWDEVMKIMKHNLQDTNVKADLTKYGGESVQDVNDRLTKFYTMLRQDYSQEVPLIVAHDGIILLMHLLLKGRELAEVANASVHEFEI